jgi:acetylornithine deacetylase/succinyl-diaminopimelate desuccinylase-like protein
MTEFPTIKIGPGHSSRSHTADEYILISEIQNGIQTYCNLLEKINSISYETLEKHKRKTI